MRVIMKLDNGTWMNTPGYSDTNIAGKPLHLVNVYGKSLCGLYRNKWTIDLFNDTKCIRCLNKLKQI